MGGGGLLKGRVDYHHNGVLNSQRGLFNVLFPDVSEAIHIQQRVPSLKNKQPSLVKP